MRRIIGKDKKGKTILINVPSYDNIYINNQTAGQAAYDISVTSNGNGLPTAIVYLAPANYSGSGTVWPDVSGYNRNATLYNSPTYSGSYFNFTGSGTQYADFANLGDLSKWTFDIWFKVNVNLNTKEATAALTTVFDDGVTNYGVINFCLGSDIPSGTYNSKLAVGFFDGAWHQNAPFTPTIGTWYNVIGTYDGTSLKQYINGTLNDTLNYSGVSSANGAPVRIARRWDGPTNTIHYFPGDVGIVRIYNTALDSYQTKTSFEQFRTTYGI